MKGAVFVPEQGGRMIRLPAGWADDWQIVSTLGRGAASTVYRAVRYDRPNIDAAIKYISIPADPSEVNYLIAEGYNTVQSQSYYDDVARQYIAEIEFL